MIRKYYPADFEYPLNEFMENAYDAYSKNNRALLNAAAAHIDVEVKVETEVT